MRTLCQIKLLGYNFEGPFSLQDQLPREGGVYAATERRADGLWYVLDIGQTECFADRLQNHDRTPQWRRHLRGQFGLWLNAMPWAGLATRLAVERELRNGCRPPCGER